MFLFIEIEKQGHKKEILILNKKDYFPEIQMCSGQINGILRLFLFKMNATWLMRGSLFDHECPLMTFKEEVIDKDICINNGFLTCT